MVHTVHVRSVNEFEDDDTIAMPSARSLSKRLPVRQSPDDAAKTLADHAKVVMEASAGLTKHQATLRSHMKRTIREHQTTLSTVALAEERWQQQRAAATSGQKRAQEEAAALEAKLRALEIQVRVQEQHQADASKAHERALARAHSDTRVQTGHKRYWQGMFDMLVHAVHVDEQHADMGPGERWFERFRDVKLSLSDVQACVERAYPWCCSARSSSTLSR